MSPLSRLRGGLFQHHHDFAAEGAEEGKGAEAGSIEAFEDAQHVDVILRLAASCTEHAPEGVEPAEEAESLDLGVWEDRLNDCEIVCRQLSFILGHAVLERFIFGAQARSHVRIS